MTSKMNPELKAKWVEALRSGKYKQAQGKLRTHEGDAHCCLGVLCEVMGLEPRGPGYFMPDKALRTVGLNKSVPGLGSRGVTQAYLITMNDSGAPFSEIADWIEANL